MSDHTDESGESTGSARVLRFRPRTSINAPSRAVSLDDGLPPADDADDDFQHRMLVNVAGLACAIILTASGIWLASRISELRHTQDCVLSGRRNCAPVAAVDKQSTPSRQH